MEYIKILSIEKETHDPICGSEQIDDKYYKKYYKICETERYELEDSDVPGDYIRFWSFNICTSNNIEMKIYMKNSGRELIKKSIDLDYLITFLEPRCFSFDRFKIEVSDYSYVKLYLSKLHPDSVNEIKEKGIEINK